MTKDELLKLALDELAEEERKELVKKYKERLKKRSLFRRLFPWRIRIEKITPHEG